MGYIFIFWDPTLGNFAFYIYTLTQNLFLYSVYLARYIQEVYKNKVNEKKEDFLKWPWHWLFFCFASKICIKTLLISLILKPSLKVALVIFTPDCRPWIYDMDLEVFTLQSSSFRFPKIKEQEFHIFFLWFFTHFFLYMLWFYKKKCNENAFFK